MGRREDSFRFWKIRKIIDAENIITSTGISLRD
jgi:hypothetical protein